MNEAIVHVTLEDFLRTGVFGPIKFGMSREELRLILGEPDYCHQRRKDKHPTLLQYGDFEFYFLSSQDNRLCTIYLHHFNDIKGNERLNVESWGLKGRMPLSEVEEKLSASGISFQHTPHPDPTMVCITTASGVEVGFCKEPSSVGLPLSGLYYLSRSLRQEMEIFKPVKQVSVTIPEAVYEKIRRASLKRRQKISKMCSEWIIEKAKDLAE